MSKPEFAPARLHGFLAKDAPIGVIVRRGPTDWCQIILWHTDTDRFECGQWFHGTIYPQACDLSPDGKKFLYFAAKHKLRNIPNAMNKWTAISRPPYLTALALWPIHDFSWLGGGVFVDDNTIVLEADAKRIPEKGSVPSEVTVILSDYEGAKQAYESRRAESRRAESGWSQIQEGKWKSGHYDPPKIFR